MLYKLKLKKFYLLGPWFSVFTTQIGDTEYGVGWLPLGDVDWQLTGMIDESMDKEQMKKLCLSVGSFAPVRAWQGLIIMVGRSIVVRVLLGVLILTATDLYGVGASCFKRKCSCWGVVW